MFKWIVALAWVTGVLSLTGVGVILYNLSSPPKAKTAKHTLKSIQTPFSKTLPIGTRQQNTASKIETKELASNSEAVKVTIQESVAVGNLATNQKSSQTINSTGVKSYTLDTESRDRYLSVESLKQLLADIQTIAVRYNVGGQCIQLVHTPASKNSTLFNQVEKYLLSNQFMVMEKELLNTDISGIKILPLDNCISITIGRIL